MLSQDNNLTQIIDNDLLTLAENMDTAFSTKYGQSTQIKNALTCIKNDYLTPNTNLWADMDIFLSSFKLKDKRICIAIKDNLIRYIRFLTKMITDEGLSRSMSIDRGFTNSLSSGTQDKNYYSETPSMQLDNFEEAIKYASNLSKNEGTTNTSQNGTSYERNNAKTWDEARKNLEYAFYNDLMQYIIKIPNELYMYYALDGRPVPELMKSMYDYMKTVINL